jgi:predicted dehydrogenase
MKFLIAGFGSIGRRHLNNLRLLGESDFVLFRSKKSTLPGDEIQGMPCETDLQAALEHKPDAVIISNPTALHLDVAIPAAKAGCAILMEKPISHNLDRVTEFQTAVEIGGAPVLVGFQFRFHPTLRTIKSWLESGRIGKPVSTRVQWGEYLPGWHPWEDYRSGYSARTDLGGGVVNTLSHPLDYLRWFFGDVQSLWAYTSNESGLGLEVEDTAEIGLRFTNGVLGSVHLDYIKRPPEHSLQITGSEGTITWENASGTARIFHAHTGQWLEVFPPIGFERNTLFLDEMAHFLEVVKGIEKPICTMEDGIAALKLADAVHMSSNTKSLVNVLESVEKHD